MGKTEAPQVVPSAPKDPVEVMLEKLLALPEYKDKKYIKKYSAVEITDLYQNRLHGKDGNLNADEILVGDKTIHMSEILDKQLEAAAKSEKKKEADK